MAAKEIELSTNTIDIKDYANMQQMGVHSLKSWLNVRSLIMNNTGDTLSMLIKKIDESFEFDYPPALPSLLQVIKQLNK